MMTEQEARRKASRPLPLEGSDNTRDLGGYPIEGGWKTASHRLIRSDSLAELTDDDIKKLREYGVGCCIDFRTPDMCQRCPSALENVGGIAYYNIPIDDHMVHGDQNAFDRYEDMGDLYIEILEQNRQELRTALLLILQHSDQATIYHCTAGKDRTGVLSMLLLELAGVPEDVILADYQVTEYYMASKFARMREILLQNRLSLPEYCFSSSSDQLKKAMSYLHMQYGTVEEYVRDIGMTDRECKRLALLLRG